MGRMTPKNSEIDRTDNVDVHPVDVDEKAIVSRCRSAPVQPRFRPKL
jgi:hypothetical protein